MHRNSLSLLALILLLTACSWEGAKRTGYETLESLRIQQCLDRRDDPDCPTERQRRQDYDAQQQRQPGE